MIAFNILMVFGRSPGRADPGEHDEAPTALEVCRCLDPTAVVEFAKAGSGPQRFSLSSIGRRRGIATALACRKICFTGLKHQSLRER